MAESPPTSLDGFTERQKAAASHVLYEGGNCFLTGAAGTGKSFLLRYIVQELKQRHMGKSGAIAVTASTGIAATNIEGVTLHSWAGIGLGHGQHEDILAKVISNEKSRMNWINCEVLVIDEVSMILSSL